MEVLPPSPPVVFSIFGGMGREEENVVLFITDWQRRQQENENYISQLPQVGYERVGSAV